jgi:hypothetical protein
MHGIETGIQNNDKANWQIKVLARIQRDCPWHQGCTSTSEQNPKATDQWLHWSWTPTMDTQPSKVNQPPQKRKIGSKIMNPSRIPTSSLI